MLHGIGLDKRFGGVQALKDATVEVPRGSVTAIVGPNGAGKTTLFNVLCGLHPPDSGRIMLDGSDVTAMPMHLRAARGMTRTFQISRELGELTVAENLLLARQDQTGERLLPALLGVASIRREESLALLEVRSLLERVGLWSLADMPARVLSGGQKKLLELARALMTRPKLLLLDEPAAGVNPTLVKELIGFIRVLRDEGLTIVIVEHNMDMVAAIGDPVYVLAEGSVLTHGSFAEISGDRRVIDAYLGGA